MAATYFDAFPQAIDTSGDPIPGAKLTFYVAGTTTLLTTYSDDAFTTPNTNPVIAGSDGIFPAIFVQSAAFKVVLSDAADNILGTRDNVEPAGGSVAIGAVPDSSFRIAGSSDPTKLLAWEVDGQTTGTTRTRTTIDDDGTEVLQDNAQTLTSKTLTSPVLNGALSGTAFLDDDSFATATATTAASSESIKAYVDAAVFGLKWKEPCAVATTANITLSGEQTIDGVLTSASRVLVKDQSSGAENGIYVSDAGAWSRASDADTGAELEAATVYVTAGTAAADTSWNQTADSITIGVTAIAWVQVSGAGTYTAGNGLQLSSGEFLIDTSITADLSTAQTFTNKTYSGGTFSGTIAGAPAFTGDLDLSGISNAGKQSILDDLNAANVFYAENYGVTVTVASDQSTSLQSAIDAAEAAGGGIVQLPSGEIRIDVGLVIDESNVILRGTGGDTNHDGGSDQYGTRLSAYAVIDIVTVKTVSNVANAVIWGSGVQDLSLNGRDLATRCVLYTSVRGWYLQRVSAKNATTAAIDLDNYAAGTLAEAGDLQRGVCSHIAIRQIDSATSKLADGMRIGSPRVGANVSYNEFSQIDIQHWTGDGIHLRNSDNNVFNQIRVFRPGGAGASLTIDGQEVSANNQINDGNTFLRSQFQGNIAVLGTGDGFTDPTTTNYFELDGANSSSEPVFGTGCRGVVMVDHDRAENFSAISMILGDSDGTIDNARALVGNESVRIHNGSDANVVIANSDGTKAWSVNTQNSTGDFRVLRTAGTGSINLPSDLLAAGFFCNVAATDPAGLATGFGTENDIWTRCSSTTDLCEISALADDYDSSFTSTKMTQHGSAATGTTAGIANADLGRLWGVNLANMIIGTNNSAPVMFSVNGAIVGRFDTSGRLLINKASGSYHVDVDGDINVNTGHVYRVNGTAVVGAQGAAVTKTTITYSSNDPSITPDNSVTIADGSAPTVSELLELCVEMRNQIETLNDRLSAHGLIAT